MKATQRNQQSMAQSVLTTLETYKTLWIGKTTLETSINELRNYIEKILDLQIKQNMVKDIKGLAINKKILRNDLINMLVRLIGAIKCIGRTAKREELIAAVNYSETKLKREDQSDFITAIKTILLHANENIVQLKQDYDISPEWFETFTTAANKFIKEHVAIRSTKTEIKTSTSELASTCREMMNHLKNELDQDMKRFLNSPFHIAYTNSRKIYNLTNCQTTLRGYFVNELRSPIKGASLQVRIDGWREIKLRPNGHFTVKHFKGIHTASVRAKAPGYLSAEYEIPLREGHTTDFDIIMIWDTQELITTDKLNSISGAKDPH